ncbi:hypothetical protein HDV03_000986 [Kappamyces sp. JEL0829]|nr:hypothetical protein HDV03_000986 [Kappamyces sp. JEL0829]
MLSSVSPTVPFADRIYCISLEFGNCFSGYAFGSTIEPRKTYYISKEGDYLKEPTSILYTKQGERWVPTWFGHKAKEASLRTRDQPHLFYIDDVKDRVDEYSAKVAVPSHASPLLGQILADYMGHLKSVALNEAFKQFGAAFDVSLVQWIVSVPARWNHQQRSLIRMACFESGITDVASSDTLILVYEDDAALMSLRASGEVDLQAGDLVTLCDCGGERTTMTTFRVLPGGHSYLPMGKPTIVECGSESIDQELLARFQSHIGNEVFDDWVKQVPLLATRIFSQFKVLKQFFSLKKQPESSKKIRVLNNDVVLFTTSEAREIMNDVVDLILQGIDDHLKPFESHKMKVVVVGGFARNHFFSRRLVDSYGALLTIPREPSKAVLDGMQLLGTKPNAIRDRVSRFSYGTQFSKIFDARTDDPTAYRWGQPPNQFIAAFLPFTQAGKYIPPDKVFEQIVCPANDHQTEFPFGLYYSMEQNPKLAGCTELITLTVAIPPAWRHLGRENRFRILMRFGITEIKFSVIHTQSNETHESVVVL